ncbi:MAG TPA: hypothetical protein VFW25_02405 [Silvibacterium sp.]|nr:hypothetical protein [Silvibacterium sp.]
MTWTKIIRIFALCSVAMVACVADAQRPSGPHLTTEYAGCSIPDGPKIVEVTPRAPGIRARAVLTMKGTESVELDDGLRIRFGYSKQDLYANVDVESIPEASYAKSKAALIDNFEYVLASSDNVRNYKLKPRLNGFEIQGLDRTKIGGDTMGMYLFFDNPTHTAVTVYFLNEQPATHFKTMQQYAAMRDHFLDSYTACVRKALGAAR